MQQVIFLFEKSSCVCRSPVFLFLLFFSGWIFARPYGVLQCGPSPRIGSQGPVWLQYITQDPISLITFAHLIINTLYYCYENFLKYTIHSIDQISSQVNWEFWKPLQIIWIYFYLNLALNFCLTFERLVLRRLRLLSPFNQNSKSRR